jgi:ribulose-5-phosphate 4-epimerase/fuculose-1-phosphate aldolase
MVDSLRADVAVANHIAYREGLVGAFGHVSARIPGTDSFWIPRRAAPMFARPESLLRVDLEGHVLEGDAQPNTEMWIHARIYAARPDVGAVAHVHSPACVVVGQLGTTVRPLHNSGALAGRVSVFERAGLIRTRALGDEVAETLGRGRAMLLRGHGANVAEKDVRRAIVIACFLEEAAEMQLRALAAAGGDTARVQFFDDEENARLSEELSDAPIVRAWEYYSARALV